MEGDPADQSTLWTWCPSRHRQALLGACPGVSPVLPGKEAVPTVVSVALQDHGTGMFSARNESEFELPSSGHSRQCPRRAGRRLPASWCPAFGFTEIHENVISPLDLSDIKGNVLHSRHTELKEKLRSINQGLERLRRVSRQGYSTEAGECPPGTVGS